MALRDVKTVTARECRCKNYQFEQRRGVAILEKFVSCPKFVHAT
jgi:hypothetical protein